MKFRTEINIDNSGEKIHFEDKIFSIGSCFSTEISDLLAKGQLRVLNNPFGTIFNPYSINNAIHKITKAEQYSETNLIEYDGIYLSLDHHSSFNSRKLEDCLAKINSEIKYAHQFLNQTNWVIITYGTAFIYEFTPQNKLVANCHKLPQKFFKKRLLTINEIQDSIKQTISYIKNHISQNVQVLFSISPVRHTKDGFQENQRSKSRLIDCLHEVISEENNCHYLPIYEIMMDDLRDYRFYKEDLIHPNQQAVNYIFDKFGKAYFSADTMDFINQNFKIHQGLSHKTSDENNPKYIEFRKNIDKLIEEQQKKVSFKIFQ